MFMILKTVYFQLGFLYKSDFRISTARTRVGIIIIKHFQMDKDISFHIFDQIKVSRVLL